MSGIYAVTTLLSAMRMKHGFGNQHVMNYVNIYSEVDAFRLQFFDVNSSVLSPLFAGLMAAKVY